MNCPKCYESSPGGASFCRLCGTALAASSSAAPGPALAKSDRDGAGQPGTGLGASRPLIIGREAGADLQINSPRISSRHASLTPQPDGRYLLRDLGSVNGVFVGSLDHRIQSALVGLDELVYFADQSFRVDDLVGSLRPGGGGPARLRIGREADNEIVIKDESVSRHHAVLERDARSAWWLEDLGSRNGTRVGGRPISRQTVLAADALAFGGYEARAGDLMAKAAPVRAGLRSARPGSAGRGLGGLCRSYSWLRGWPCWRRFFYSSNIVHQPAPGRRSSGRGRAPGA